MSLLTREAHVNLTHLDGGRSKEPSCKVTEVHASDMRRVLREAAQDGVLGAAAKRSHEESVHASSGPGRCLPHAPENLSTSFVSSTPRPPTEKRSKHLHSYERGSKKKKEHPIFKTSYTSSFETVEALAHIATRFNNPDHHHKVAEESRNTTSGVFSCNEYGHNGNIDHPVAPPKRMKDLQRPSTRGEVKIELVEKKKFQRSAIDRILAQAEAESNLLKWHAQQKSPRCTDNPLKCSSHSTLAQFLGRAPIADKLASSPRNNSKSLKLPLNVLLPSGGAQPSSARESYVVSLGRKKKFYQPSTTRIF